MDMTMESTEDKTLKVLERGPATPEEVYKELGIAWATAKGVPYEAGWGGVKPEADFHYLATCI